MSALVTFEQYVEMPEPAEFDTELRFGQVVRLPWPTFRHVDSRHRIWRLLESRLGPAWKVLMGMPYRALPEFESRNADVGVVSTKRWGQALKAASLAGSPEIVIEILSPRSTPETSALCLGTGAMQFWAVDEQNSSVTVSTASGTRVFTTGERMPLGIADASLAVDEIFA